MNTPPDKVRSRIAIVGAAGSIAETLSRELAQDKGGIIIEHERQG